MSNVKSRIKILQRIAQQAATPAVTTTTSTSTVTPAPPPFQASAVYPGIRLGFNSASVALIDQLVSLLNLALQYSSNGTANFQIFRNNNFNFDGSSTSNVDQKNLMMFSQAIYRTILNNGNPFPQALTPQEIQDMLLKLSTSASLSALSQTDPTGPIAQKVPGNLKTNITSYLQYLSSTNPVAQR